MEGPVPVVAVGQVPHAARDPRPVLGPREVDGGRVEAVGQAEEGVGSAASALVPAVDGEDRRVWPTRGADQGGMAYGRDGTGQRPVPCGMVTFGEALLALAKTLRQ